jgi:hypothetical protein
MGSRIGVSEAADLSFLVVQQPADTVLRCIAINKQAVLIWHARDSGDYPDRVSSTGGG